MGITPYDNQSSFALMHRYRIFHGYQALGQSARFFPAGARPFFPSPLNGDNGYEHDHHGAPTDFEAFRVLELRGKYFLSQRMELNAFVPYVMNTSPGPFCRPPAPSTTVFSYPARARPARAT